MKNNNIIQRKAMTAGSAFQRKAMTEGIAFRRKAMTAAISLVVTVVVLLAVGLIVYLISSGVIIDFGQNSKDQQNSSFNAIKCTTACNGCCLLKPTTGGDTYDATEKKCTITSVPDCACPCD